MNKIIFYIIGLLILSHSSYGQNGIISTVAGTGVSGSTGDGGMATSATIGRAQCVAADNAGNIYFADRVGNTIRKISPSGIITTIAGNGTNGYSGDGGPATAARLNIMATSYDGLAVDNTGNVYICDMNARIRKIDALGIITTIAGNGSYGNSGDGGPATNAGVGIGGLAVDNAGNIYMAAGAMIRKINSAGIITAVAGNGTNGFSGDGGPATAATLGWSALAIAVDNSGNIYTVDSLSRRVRMINSSGIINTIAGNGTAGYTGDGGPATAASFSGPCGITVDKIGNILVLDGRRIRRISTNGIITTVAGNNTGGFSGDGLPGSLAQINAEAINSISANKHAVYIADGTNYRVRKLVLSPDIPSNDFSVNLDISCSGAQFSFFTNAYASSSSIKTYNGDGSSDTAVILSGGSTGYANANHIYVTSGTYTVKHILNVSGIPVDSVQYNLTYDFCNVLPIKMFFDSAATCSYDSTANRLSTAPITVQVSKNGTPIDTIAMTGGVYYRENGVNGDIYSYSILTHPPAIPHNCPATIYDTLHTGINTKDTKYWALQCLSTCTFDFDVNAIISNTEPQSHHGNIYVRNTAYIPMAATVKFNFDPRWMFYSSSPAPTSILANSVTWNLSAISNSSGVTLSYSLINAAGPLTIGDTVNDSITVIIPTGDGDPTNNYIIVTDTVRAGFDPNEMFVNPQGYIASGDQLKYTIDFMNTGNDTAHNIYVMDTLSDFVDPSTLRIVTTTNVMNITMMYDNICHNIVKFDFPKINLLDSSHHDACTANVVFSIKTKSGLPNGTQILNQAGIYFDVNDVVMTNAVENIIGYPSKIINAGNGLPDGKNIQLYPNPTTDELTIKMEQNAYSSFNISNSVGQLLMQQPLNNPLTKVNVKMLPPGLYYITVKGDNGNKVQKFLKL